MIDNGVLIRADGTIRDFYQITGAFYGPQAGVQQYSYALFLMDSGAIANIIRCNGCEVRSSPSLVIVDFQPGMVVISPPCATVSSRHLEPQITTTRRRLQRLAGVRVEEFPVGAESGALLHTGRNVQYLPVDDFASIQSGRMSL